MVANKTPMQLYVQEIGITKERNEFGEPKYSYEQMKLIYIHITRVTGQRFQHLMKERSNSI